MNNDMNVNSTFNACKNNINRDTPNFGDTIWQHLYPSLFAFLFPWYLYYYWNFGALVNHCNSWCHLMFSSCCPHGMEFWCLDPPHGFTIKGIIFLSLLLSLEMDVWDFLYYSIIEVHDVSFSFHHILLFPYPSTHILMFGFFESHIDVSSWW